MSKEANVKYSIKLFLFEFIRDSAEVLLGIFDDLDKILGTNKNFLLGNWLNSAKALATNDAVSVILCMKLRRISSIFSFNRR